MPLAPGTDLQAAAVLPFGSVQGLVMQSLIGGEVRAMAELAPGVVTACLRGLAFVALRTLKPSSAAWESLLSSSGICGIVLTK